MRLSDKVYDVLKWVVMIVLPAAGTLYASLSGIWGWPRAQEVMTSISAVEAFLGVLLGVSTLDYNKKRDE